MTKRTKILVTLWFAAIFSLTIVGFAVHFMRGPGEDFMIYVGEGYCVTHGIDPYDVWIGNIKQDRFYPYQCPELRTETRNTPIHGHTPWFYAYFLPFSADSSPWNRWVAWEVLSGSLFMLLIVGVSFRFGRDASGDVFGGLLAVAAALSIGVGFPTGFGGNNHMIATACLGGMALALVAKKDVLAGICWAFALTKPQDALLLGVPLLLARKWKTIVVAGFIITAASLSASDYCGKPIVEMLLEIPKLKLTGTGARLIPGFAYEWLTGFGVSDGLLPMLGMALGATVCLVLSWIVKESDEWLVKILPALTCATFWTYMTSADRIVLFLAQVLFVCRWVQSDSRKVSRFMVVMIAIVAVFGIDTVCGCSGMISGLCSFVGLPDLYPGFKSFMQVFDKVVHVIFVLGVAVFCAVEKRRVGLVEGAMHDKGN